MENLNFYLKIHLKPIPVCTAVQPSLMGAVRHIHNEYAGHTDYAHAHILEGFPQSRLSRGSHHYWMPSGRIISSNTFVGDKCFNVINKSHPYLELFCSGKIHVK